MLESTRRWPGFAAELSAATGLPLGYRTEGTLLVALTDDDLAEARAARRLYRRAGLPISRSPAAAARAGTVARPRVARRRLAPGDHQVDPRLLLDALRTAAAGRRARSPGVADPASRADEGDRRRRAAGRPR